MMKTIKQILSGTILTFGLAILLSGVSHGQTASQFPSNLSRAQSKATNSELAHVKLAASKGSSSGILAPRKTSISYLKKNQDIFEVVKTAPGVVLIDFYADWCGPCKRQSSLIRQVDKTAISKNATIIKINVDDHEKLTKVFKVKGLPTLMLVKDNKVISTKLGVANEAELKALLSH